MKNSDPCGDHDQSKDYSSITSSSSTSSSATSVLSSGKRSSVPEHGHQSDEESVPKRPRIESNEDHIESQEKVDQDHDDHGQKEPKKEKVVLLVTSTTSSTSSYDSNVSNNTSQVGISKQEHLEEDMDLLLDFKGPYDVSNILQEVNKPEVSDYESTVLEAVPLEADYDFWNMLDSLGTSVQPNQEVQLQDSEAACDHQSSDFGVQEYSTENENKKWFRYLESELGLEGTEPNNQNHVMHQDQVLVPAAENNDNFHYHDLIEDRLESDPCLGFSPANQICPWPQNSAAT